MEKELIELIAKVAALEKKLEEIDKRKNHCEDSRSKIYDRIAILEQDKVRNEEKDEEKRKTLNEEDLLIEPFY